MMDVPQDGLHIICPFGYDHDVQQDGEGFMQQLEIDAADRKRFPTQDLRELEGFPSPAGSASPPFQQMTVSQDDPSMKTPKEGLGVAYIDTRMSWANIQANSAMVRGSDVDMNTGTPVSLAASASSRRVIWKYSSGVVATAPCSKRLCLPCLPLARYRTPRVRFADRN